VTSIEPKTKVQTEGDTDLLVSREFNAPQHLVYRAWTTKEGLLNWWGPREWPLKHCTVDLRVGGRWHYCMGGPNGEEAWGLGVYQEITPTSRIVYIDTFSDAAGTAIPPESTVTVELVDLGNGRTLMKNRATSASKEHLEQVLAMGMVEGMTESLDRLEEHLAA
jgi:uncharacterized protein YndB with AHSA1/START domain